MQTISHDSPGTRFLMPKIYTVSQKKHPGHFFAITRVGIVGF